MKSAVHKPIISVVLPVYNGMAYLKESVESVLNQQGIEFEFLICDDCSSDNSYNYLKSLDDRRIRLSRNEKNKGLFPTLNRLISEASTELIHLWAQDDIMLPICLKETVSFHREFPEVNFSFSRLQVIDAAGKITKVPIVFPNKTLSPEEHAIISILYGSISGNIANVCVVKSACEAVGLFNAELKYVGDFDMWYKLSKEKGIGCNGKVLVHVRGHEGQLSRNLKASLYRMEENYEVYQNFLGLINTEHRKYYRRALNWKIYPQYFNQLIYILRQKQYDLAKTYAQGLKVYGNLGRLMVRWIIIRFLKILGLEKWFYRVMFLNRVDHDSSK